MTPTPKPQPYLVWPRPEYEIMQDSKKRALIAIRDLRPTLCSKPTEWIIKTHGVAHKKKQKYSTLGQLS